MFHTFKTTENINRYPLGPHLMNYFQIDYISKYEGQMEKV